MAERKAGYWVSVAVRCVEIEDTYNGGVVFPADFLAKMSGQQDDLRELEEYLDVVLDLCREEVINAVTARVAQEKANGRS